MGRPRPQVVPLESAPVTPAAEAPTRVRIARMITRERQGSDLLLGACWMGPGEESSAWSFEEEDRTAPGDHWYGPRDEVYYVIRGRLRLSWDEGDLEVGPDHAVYLAPGWTYRLKNEGDEPAFFLYAMAPAPA
jgi:mannose-6-phosphate isomerase-like protein (cupin superfamily)